MIAFVCLRHSFSFPFACSLLIGEICSIRGHSGKCVQFAPLLPLQLPRCIDGASLLRLLGQDGLHLARGLLDVDP